MLLIEKDRAIGLEVGEDEAESQQNAVWLRVRREALAAKRQSGLAGSLPGASNTSLIGLMWLLLVFLTPYSVPLQPQPGSIIDMKGPYQSIKGSAV